MQVKQLTENFFVAGQLSADDIRTAAANGIRTIINNRPDHEEPGQVESRQLEDAAAETGVTYLHLPFASGVVPSDVVDRLEADYPDLEKPVLAFCRSGMRAELCWNQVVSRL